MILNADMSVESECDDSDVDEDDDDDDDCSVESPQAITLTLPESSSPISRRSPVPPLNLNSKFNPKARACRVEVGSHGAVPRSTSVTEGDIKEADTDACVGTEEGRAGDLRVRWEPMVSGSNSSSSSSGTSSSASAVGVSGGGLNRYDALLRPRAPGATVEDSDSKSVDTSYLKEILSMVDRCDEIDAVIDRDRIVRPMGDASVDPDTDRNDCVVDIDEQERYLGTDEAVTAVRMGLGGSLMSVGLVGRGRTRPGATADDPVGP